MKFDKIFKLFAVALFLFLGFVSEAFADAVYNSTLSKIVVEEGINGNFNLNLVFNEKFTGNAFIQKRENGSFYVFIPDTIANKKGVKVLYRNSKDKGIIKLGIEESVYNNNSNYIKISVGVIGGHSIQLFSKTVEEQAAEAPIYSFDKYNIVMLCIFLITGILIWKLISVARKNGYSFSKQTRYSSRSISRNLLKDAYREPKYIDTEYNNYSSEPASDNKSYYDVNHVLPRVNMKKSMKSSEGEAFSCFDIPFVNESEYATPEIEMKKQLASMKKDKISRSKSTNPITKNLSQLENEFSLPMIGEKASETPSQPKKEVKSDEPELLSELRITPRKGFYLTSTDDKMFALFGFVDTNVFLLKKFSDLSQINLQARFYDRQQNNDLYIVRLDSYKAMVEISDTGMRELAVL